LPSQEVRLLIIPYVVLKYGEIVFPSSVIIKEVMALMRRIANSVLKAWRRSNE